MQIAPALQAKFWSRVDRRGSDECWLWSGAKVKGYGLFRVAGRNRRATQIAWSLANAKDFPTGLFACHSCDNPPCVNPAHIWPGTPKQNFDDAVSKGRMPEAVFRTKPLCDHPLTGDNVLYARGRPYCRQCARARNGRWHDRQRLKAVRVESVYGPGKICRTCGHSRVDDVVYGTRPSGTPHYACRACDHAKSQRRRSRAASLKTIIL
jgi:hypothetical protein